MADFNDVITADTIANDALSALETHAETIEANGFSEGNTVALAVCVAAVAVCTSLRALEIRLDHVSHDGR